ncbi:serine hydrolase domain-containing protein [Aeromicrobium fastidiosum]|uniref:Beta-lactamase family protein n=1 Tax=Aeromicrobium fastidiosum TaxID=52699 RepID=A0A641AJP3_9ACTN|nr:serine hydrolase domain-containing protein [Aeromicrobium fastidiosum]KAA1376061.1 beta-lactamase family protein [Aeromicrobium fastidiosum]MBP2392068.1 CubicO group peptidase (beta-lactamase class C family) [Aeromicrobium fastidiosum]
MRRVVVASAVLAVAGCSGAQEAGPQAPPSRPAASTSAPSTPSAPPTPAAVFPGETWQRADAGDWSNLDAELSAEGSTCVAVVKDGVLVHDAYWNGGAPGSGQRIYSITKSLTALLVGMQADDGTLDLDDTASEPVDEWRGTDAEAVTVRDLLSMTSGRRWSEASDRQMIRATADQTNFAVGIDQQRPPGQAWVYDNAAAQTLESVLDDLADSDDVVELATDRLLDPLGMRDTTWARDAAGNALTYSGAESTCLDLARVGHLMLNRGRWDGRQLLSADLVEQLTSPSSELNAAYGLLWWTNAAGRVVEIRRQAGFADDLPPYEGRLAPSVPEDAFWALGYGNQYIAVVPGENLVAVRLGARPSSPDRITFDTFTAGVLDGLGDAGG